MVSIRREVPKLWQWLMGQGWVNITGLLILTSYEGVCTIKGIVLPQPGIEPGVGRNNGMSVVYLPDGTVWLKAGYEISPDLESMGTKHNAFVPFSNGEFMPIRNILERVANPFWHGAEATNPELPGRPKLGYFERPATLEELQRHPEFIKKNGEVYVS